MPPAPAHGNQRVILVMAEFFAPAWKAGGTTAAITSLQRHFAGDDAIFFYIFCRARDMDNRLVIPKDKVNSWLPLENGAIFYAEPPYLNSKTVRAVITDTKPKVVYINGLFSKVFAMHPLMALRKHRHIKRVLAPHGMLHESALEIKSWKKRVYLNVLQRLSCFSHVQWQATDEQEYKDILRFAGKHAQVQLVPNIPKTPQYLTADTSKKEKTLRLVFLSLISEKKNLMYALRRLQEWDRPVQFDIYGPLKNAMYWKQCEEFIAKLPPHIQVNYGGEVSPVAVQQTFQQYDALLLPTTGENFGYAIFECLSVGRPVIISDQTPWRQLASRQAGFDLPLDNPKAFIAALEQLWLMEEPEFNQWRKGAFSLATNYLAQHNYSTAYKQLFFNH